MEVQGSQVPAHPTLPGRRWPGTGTSQEDPAVGGEAEEQWSQDVMGPACPAPPQVSTSLLRLHVLVSGDRKRLEKEPDSEWAGEEIRNLHLPI